MGLRRALIVGLLGLIGLGASALAQDGPLRDWANTLVRTDGNGYLLVVSGQYTAPDGPLRAAANQQVRTDGNGYLLIAFPGGLSVDDFFRLRTTNTAAPSAANCDAAAETGRFHWDSTNDNLRVCSGASGWFIVNSAAGAPTGAEYIVSTAHADLTAEDVLTEGAAIDVANAVGTSTVAVDLTELSTVTLGAGAFTTLTFDAGATDPVITASSNTLNLALNDALLTFGTGGDVALVERSTALGADTALTGVLIGVPVTTGVAADSLILSNATASGDILLAANRGGNSEEYFFADSSLGRLYLSGYQDGIVLCLAPDCTPAGVNANFAGVTIWSGNSGEFGDPVGNADSKFAIESAGNAYIQVLTPDANTAGLIFGDASAANAAYILYAHGSDIMTFRSNGTDQWQIDASGDLQAVTDNADDIGASGATRPRDVYIADQLVLGSAAATGLAGSIFFTGVTNANLGTPSNGTVIYCSDCTIANPCAGGGTGALAKRLNGAWVCN